MSIFHGLLCAAALSTPTLCQGTPSYVLINEIRIGNALGAPIARYFELLGGPVAADLTGYTYLVIGSNYPSDPSGVILVTLDLSGQSMDAHGLFLAADPLSSVVGVPHLSTPLAFLDWHTVTHVLVVGFTGQVGDDLDTDNDGIVDVTPWESVSDAIALVRSGPPTLPYGLALGGVDVEGGPNHVFRCRTSLEDVRKGNYAFHHIPSSDTPGAFNGSCAVATSVFCDPGEPNSFSVGGGVMGYTGTGSVSVNDSALTCSNVPNTFGMFLQSYYVYSPVVSPIGGNLCLRFHARRMNEIVLATSNVATLPLDFADPARVESSVDVGNDYYYQYFHRDTVFAGGGNFSDGIRIVWAY